MPEAKTKATKGSVKAFIDGVENETRRKDAEALLKIFSRVTGEKPVMWGPTIIGYGEHHYKYASGREGVICKTGFSPRASALVLYVLGGAKSEAALLKRLGKHKHGKGCLYINKLADIDLAVLEELIATCFTHMRAKTA